MANVPIPSAQPFHIKTESPEICFCLNVDQRLFSFLLRTFSDFFILIIFCVCYLPFTVVFNYFEHNCFMFCTSKSRFWTNVNYQNQNWNWNTLLGKRPTETQLITFLTHFSQAFTYTISNALPLRVVPCFLKGRQWKSM